MLTGNTATLGLAGQQRAAAEAAAAEEEEKTVKAIHEQRKAAAMALLNQHNPDWFAQVEGAAGPKEKAKGHDDTASSGADAGAGVEKQKATAGGVATGQHNSDSARSGEDVGAETLSSSRQSQQGGEKEITPEQAKREALAEVAKQRAAAMALLDEHNSDWFGGIDDVEKKDKSSSSRRSFRE